MNLFETIGGEPIEPTPQDVSNFLFDAMKYIQERRPHELMTIQILREMTYDVMDVEIGRQRDLNLQ